MNEMTAKVPLISEHREKVKEESEQYSEYEEDVVSGPEMGATVHDPALEDSDYLNKNEHLVVREKNHRTESME